MSGRKSKSAKRRLRERERMRRWNRMDGEDAWIERRWLARREAFIAQHGRPPSYIEALEYTRNPLVMGIGCSIATSDEMAKMLPFVQTEAVS